jgi:dihydroorotate dehydrogenase
MCKKSYLYKYCLRPILFQCDGEWVHERALSAAGVANTGIGARALRGLFSYEDEVLHCSLFDLPFSNPLGLAAGFDKNVDIVPFLSAIGFGHVEVGTITPKPQPGNPRPRIFRYPQIDALVNRMGFPSGGVDAAVENLTPFGDERGGAVCRGMQIAVNIGKNKATPLEHAADDYAILAKDLSGYAAWLTINVSSPNTPGLRDLQTKESLGAIVEAVRQHATRPLPICVKLAPDLTEEQLDALVKTLIELRIDGIVLSNTTIRRDGRCEIAKESGGLSGRPLFERTVETVRRVFAVSGGELPIIAVGGVARWQEIAMLLIEGASLVQIYTAFIYEGPAWPGEALRGVAEFCKSQGLSSVHDMRGRKDLLPLLAA